MPLPTDKQISTAIELTMMSCDTYSFSNPKDIFRVVSKVIDNLVNYRY